MGFVVYPHFFSSTIAARRTQDAPRAAMARRGKEGSVEAEEEESLAPGDERWMPRTAARKAGARHPRDRGPPRRSRASALAARSTASPPTSQRSRSWHEIPFLPTSQSQLLPRLPAPPPRRGRAPEGPSATPVTGDEPRTAMATKTMRSGTRHHRAPSPCPRCTPSSTSRSRRRFRAPHAHAPRPLQLPPPRGAALGRQALPLRGCTRRGGNLWPTEPAASPSTATPPSRSRFPRGLRRAALRRQARVVLP